MPYTDDWSVAVGKTVEAVNSYPKRFVVRLSDGVDIDVRPSGLDEGVSIGVWVPEEEVPA